ncbi:alpha-hydroxy acid oxidase [Gemmatimonas groenlandica]|uniref:Alpha-hydroxy-acid oxidizing protein n=1 Tax=Gemmatimonas groenlandica TaxID=2732249 RepID=A0A6M4IIV5_9BACT|nr:alpha-hydroxy acid oxidase [Gemmatimonas groenlandica]QJR34713.1 alpha-hydroxy-acid oxidizing protein [Gemmatimonas groenlandica]
MPTSTPLINLHNFEAAAADVLPRMVYDYYAGGANDEVALGAAHAAWNDITLRYRVLRDVSERSQRTEVLGHTLDWPVFVAPMAFQQLAHADGEVATAMAAEATGAGMILSTLSNRTIEAVRAGTSGPLWFQLYIYRDRGVTAELVRRAERAGCTALVLAVDAPLLGRRERDLLNGLHLPPDVPVPNLGVTLRDTLAADRDVTGSQISALAEFFDRHWDPSIAWRDLAWLRSITTLPILVKGVVRGDDAVLAIEHGAAGVIVSNHGGRQLDTAIPTARALPGVADALRGRGTVLVDGGIRRGTDVIKALAMGAQAVLLGRPVLWGLAVNGQPGAKQVLQLLKDECDLALALAGCRTPAEVTADLIA